MKTIGIDIGGTQLRAAIFDEEGKLLDKFITPNDSSQEPEKNADKLIQYISSQNYQYKGIGIGCPGPINIRLGKILNPPNLYTWEGFEIVKYFEERTHIKTLLNNDANVAGLAEAVRGAGKGYESVFYITISTGIGGAYIYRGEIVCGANSTAAELYNMIVNEDTYSHNGVNAGAVNEQCSGTALARIAGERYQRKMEPKELFELYYKRDQTAVEIIDTCVDNMAKAVANVACTVDPDIFVVGGSVALYNPGLVGMIEERAKNYVICPQFLRMQMAEFEGDAGLIGAALLV